MKKDQKPTGAASDDSKEPPILTPSFADEIKRRLHVDYAAMSMDEINARNKAMPGYAYRNTEGAPVAVFLKPLEGGNMGLRKTVRPGTSEHKAAVAVMQDMISGGAAMLSQLHTNCDTPKTQVQEYIDEVRTFIEANAAGTNTYLEAVLGAFYPEFALSIDNSALTCMAPTSKLYEMYVMSPVSRLNLWDGADYRDLISILSRSKTTKGAVGDTGLFTLLKMAESRCCSLGSHSAWEVQAGVDVAQKLRESNIELIRFLVHSQRTGSIDYVTLAMMFQAQVTLRQRMAYSAISQIAEHVHRLKNVDWELSNTLFEDLPSLLLLKNAQPHSVPYEPVNGYLSCPW